PVWLVILGLIMAGCVLIVWIQLFFEVNLEHAQSVNARSTFPAYQQSHKRRRPMQATTRRKAKKSCRKSFLCNSFSCLRKSTSLGQVDVPFNTTASLDQDVEV